MTRALIVVLGVVLAAAACTEHLTTPGSCPTFCPGGQSAFRDTILTPVQGADSSFTGFVAPSNLTSVLASNGGLYGDHRAVIRFLSRGDSVVVSDSSRSFTVDSVAIELGIQDRDTTVANFVLEIYRLPITIDSTATLAALDALFTPANLLAEVPEPASFRSGVFHVTFTGDSLTHLAFSPSDSGVLEIGLRVRADAPTGARIGTPASGTFAPAVTNYVKAIGVIDSLKATSIGRTAVNFFTVSTPSPPPATSLLAVGGIPVSRSFIRFVLPPFLKDSATIIRATLEVQADAPLVGIPADTAVLVATSVLVDFGAKSPVVAGVSAILPLVPGLTAASLEVTPLVQLWQGKTATPSIVRLALADEGGTFLSPLFRSTRSASGAPTLRITYRPPFAFEGY
ncbi:MAG: hypothetical protein ACRELE_10425 [Gemmatimonadales bacterium]